MSSDTETWEELQNKILSDAPVDSKINHEASLKYWNSLPSTASTMLGMLGDYPWYTGKDLQGSRDFLSKVLRQLPDIPRGKLKLAVDCGAGVGRVTEGFLSHACEVVDAVEPIKKFAQVMQDHQLKRDGVIGDIYTVGLENWVPEKKYDLIWAQWCVGHLTDAQLTDTLLRCREALTETGIVGLKENISLNDDDEYDDEDSAVTRADVKFRQIFAAANMVVIKSEIQTGYPEEMNLLPVMSYALRPSD
ncbi:hypothetical protein VI817_005281 [Penicillium citrinum]|nr:hypothetical protein VI817_005281 [Penicillium citrinum]